MEKSRNDFLEDAIESVLKEWDILPSERKYSIEDLRDWLHTFLGVKIELLRAALYQSKQEKPYSKEDWAEFHRILELARSQLDTNSALAILYKMGYWEAIKDRSSALQRYNDLKKKFAEVDCLNQELADILKRILSNQYLIEDTCVESIQKTSTEVLEKVRLFRGAASS